MQQIPAPNLVLVLLNLDIHSKYVSIKEDCSHWNYEGISQLREYLFVNVHSNCLSLLFSLNVMNKMIISDGYYVCLS